MLLYLISFWLGQFLVIFRISEAVFHGIFQFLCVWPASPRFLRSLVLYLPGDLVAFPFHPAVHLAGALVVVCCEGCPWRADLWQSSPLHPCFKCTKKQPKSNQMHQKATPPHVLSGLHAGGTVRPCLKSEPCSAGCCLRGPDPVQGSHAAGGGLWVHPVPLHLGKGGGRKTSGESQ